MPSVLERLREAAKKVYAKEDIDDAGEVKEYQSTGETRDPIVPRIVRAVGVVRREPDPRAQQVVQAIQRASGAVDNSRAGAIARATDKALDLHMTSASTGQTESELLDAQIAEAEAQLEALKGATKPRPLEERPYVRGGR